MSHHRDQGGRLERRAGREPALLVLTAALLLPAALLNGSAGVPSPTALAVGGATTVGALVVLTVWTARVLLPPGVISGARHVLDVVGALLLAPAIALGLALDPLVQVSSLPAQDVALLLVVPSVALIVLVVVLSALRLYRGSGALRTVLVTTIVTSVMLTWATGAAVAGGLGVSTGGRTVLVAGAVLTLGALITLVVLPSPEPPARAPREDMVMYGRVGQVAVVVALLGADHVLDLPTVAVVLALSATAVHLAGIALVHAQLGSLDAGRRRAATDDLTGLGNRRVLTEALAGVDAGDVLAVVLLDLDRFTSVNGAVGQRAGDDLLRQVAGRLRRGAGTDEVVLRLGSDEFVLLLPASSAAAAMARARALLLALAAPFEVGGRTLSMSASIGVAAAHGADAQASTGEELLRQAESALAAAVQDQACPGTSSLRSYDAQADAAHRDEGALVTDLRAAVAADALTAHFQPQLDAGGALVGVEALVRWEHPVRGTMAPFAFLPLVAREGLMDDLTEQVLRRALALVAGWEAATGAPAPRVSVNISATSLLDEQLVATVAGALVAAGVGADRLVLEVTETELMADPQTSRRVLEALVGLGVDVSIDDYGTGHSSLAYLKDLPVGELKLDRSFVADLCGGDPRTTAIVRTTVDLAHSLGLRLVAEGVEDTTTLAALLDLGVDVTQGYHHGRPVPAREMVRWAVEHSRHLDAAR